MTIEIKTEIAINIGSTKKDQARKEISDLLLEHNKSPLHGEFCLEDSNDYDIILRSQDNFSIFNLHQISNYINSQTKYCAKGLIHTTTIGNTTTKVYTPEIELHGLHYR